MQKIWGWFTANPIAQFLGAIVLALIGWEVVKRNIQETGRIKERERQAVASAREQERVTQARDSIEQENRNAATRADAAVANLPNVISADELRARDPALAALVFGPASGGGRQPES